MEYEYIQYKKERFLKTNFTAVDRPYRNAVLFILSSSIRIRSKQINSQALVVMKKNSSISLCMYIPFHFE
jgi:hypothetical protein